MTSDEERYQISDWTPPWLDNGEALLTVILSARNLDNALSWQIICSLLQRQLEIDLRIAKEVNFMFNPDVNEDALPYMWDADVKMRNLQKFYDSIPQDMLSDDGGEDDEDFD